MKSGSWAELLSSQIPAPFTVWTLSQSVCLCGGVYAHHTVAELTLCLWRATATVQCSFHILRLRSGHKNTVKGEEKTKQKQKEWLMLSFDLIFLPPPERMIADYLYLSVQFGNNCSLCAYLMEDLYAPSVISGWIYNTPVRGADVIIFAVFA